MRTDFPPETLHADEKNVMLTAYLNALEDSHSPEKEKFRESWAQILKDGLGNLLIDSLHKLGWELRPIEKKKTGSELLKEWIGINYPMMEADQDYSELDSYDIIKFANWIATK